MKERGTVIRPREAGRTVADILHARWHIPRSAADHLAHEGRVLLAGRVCRDPRTRVRPGQHLRLSPKPSAERAPAAHGIRVCYVDPHVVVVDKPAGVTTVRHREEAAEFGARARRFLPPTLVDLLPDVLAPGQGRRMRVRAVHRLDKETTGLVVLARTAVAEQHLGRQFRAHSIERRYLAIVRGQARDERIESYLVRDRGDGRRGSSPGPGEGQRAVTHVRVIEALAEFTLVECRLETGRTHQVRIHLGERGTPLCGERIYDRPLHGAPLPDATGLPRPALHAAHLAIDHPASGKRIEWQAPLPRDMKRLLDRLRRQAKN